MIKNEQKRTSKFLSLVLRHKPEAIGLELDKNGWASVEDLLDKMNQKNFSINKEQLIFIVENNDKKRFSFSEGKKKIRANQGHSLQVDLGLKETIPPEILYHGTAAINLTSIKEKGLLKAARHHVHLSTDEETAKNVGMRYGKPVVLKIKAGEMHRQGYQFFKSKNEVWLTKFVAIHFIVFP